MSLYQRRLAAAKLRRRPAQCADCICHPKTDGFNPIDSGAFIKPYVCKNPHLIVLGACGGVEEEEQGEPLVGKAGRKLRRGLEWAADGRVLRYERWNLVNCRLTRMSQTGQPFVVNRKPNQMRVREMRDCSSRWLFPALRATKARVVLILGVDVHRFVLGERFGGFHKSMGERCLIPQTGITPTGLPAQISSYGKLYTVEV